MRVSHVTNSNQQTSSRKNKRFSVEQEISLILRQPDSHCSQYASIPYPKLIKPTCNKISRHWNTWHITKILCLNFFPCLDIFHLTYEEYFEIMFVCEAKKISRQRLKFKKFILVMCQTQLLPPSPLSKILYSIQMFSRSQILPSRLFLFVFPIQNCIPFLFSHVTAICPARASLPNMAVLIIFGEREREREVINFII